MNGTSIARIAKICALLGFFLPWTLVSCSGQPIASMSGLSLAMGDIALKNPVNGAMEHQHGSPNIFLLLAIVAIVGGLALSFTDKDQPGHDVKQTARTLLISAALAAALCVFGLMAVYNGRDKAFAKAQQTNQIGGDVAATMIQVKTQYGFWVTMLALAVAAGAPGLILTNRESLLDAMGTEARRLAAGAGAAGISTPAEQDERYWDRLPDKNDPDALEEYLLRFPGGKFAPLARTRLQRAGIPVAEPASPPEPAPADVAPAESAPIAAAPPLADPAPPAPEPDASPARFEAVPVERAVQEVPPPPPACPSCSTLSAIGDRFCSACGSALPA